MRTVPLFLLLFAAPALPSGQEPANARSNAPAAGAVAAEKPAPARTMVFHLDGGAIVRARARASESGWEIWQSGAWTPIPAERVLRVASEKELLERAQGLEKKVPRGDLVRRVAYADWLIAEGLHVEALAALDRVLGADPDQPDAVLLLARASLKVALPELPAGGSGIEKDVERYLGEAAQGGPTFRELAIQRLRPLAGTDGMHAALLQELTDHSPRRRTLAALALRRLFPGSDLIPMLDRALLDPSDDVREGASLALRAADSAVVIEPVVRALGASHPAVRKHAIEALGHARYREAVGPLVEHLTSLQSGGSAAAPRRHIFSGRQVAFVQDYDVEVAQGAAIADPIINVLAEGVVLDTAVIGVNDYVLANERASVRRTLSKLTGADPGDSAEAWQRWWMEHEAAGRAEPSPRTGPTSQSRDR